MTSTPSFNVGDRVFVISRAKDPYGRQTSQIIGKAEGVVEKSEDGELVLVTEQGYRFALSGWTEYRKASAKK